MDEARRTVIELNPRRPRTYSADLTDGALLRHFQPRLPSHPLRAGQFGRRHAALGCVPPAATGMLLALNLCALFWAQEAACRMDSGLILNVTDTGQRKPGAAFRHTCQQGRIESLIEGSGAPWRRNPRRAIAPGLFMPSGNVVPEEWIGLSAASLRRPASAAEITRLLILPKRYITGQTIFVDGGYSPSKLTRRNMPDTPQSRRPFAQGRRKVTAFLPRLRPMAEVVYSKC